jgi:hypothetical protein
METLTKELLEDMETDVTLKTKRGYTPLHLAAARDQYEVGM